MRGQEVAVVGLGYTAAAGCGQVQMMWAWRWGLAGVALEVDTCGVQTAGTGVTGVTVELMWWRVVLMQVQVQVQVRVGAEEAGGRTAAAPCASPSPPQGKPPQPAAAVWAATARQLPLLRPSP